MKKLLLLLCLGGNMYSDGSRVATVFDFLDLSYVGEVTEQDRMICGTSAQFDEFVLNIDDAKIKWLKDLTKERPHTSGQGVLGTPKDNDKSFFLVLRYVRALQALKTLEKNPQEEEELESFIEAQRNLCLQELEFVWEYYPCDSFEPAYLGSLEQTAILDIDKRAELLEFYREERFASYPNLKSRVIYWSSFA